MSEGHASSDGLVPLGEAERICREQAGMSEAQFRHELAEYVRGNGGLAWVATETAQGVRRPALDELIRSRTPRPENEDTHDTGS